LRHYRREIGRPPEVVVMASGCLGLLSFPRQPGRLTLEHIEALYPSLVEGLREHPGVGFLLVRSEKRRSASIPRYVVWRRHPYNPIGERLGRDSRVASQQECLLG
jgi:hypothetical protein